MSLIVAVSSLIFTYRQHFGWKPIVLVAEQGVLAGHHTQSVKLNIEVWNRHPFPIVVTTVKVSFHQIELNASSHKIEDWYVKKNECSNVDDFPVKGGEHHKFELKIPMQKMATEAIDDPVFIKVDYFDSRRNLNLSTHIIYQFNYRSLND